MLMVAQLFKLTKKICELMIKELKWMDFIYRNYTSINFLKIM